MRDRRGILFALTILVLLFVITSNGSASDDKINIKLIESYVKDNYLLPDKARTAIPSNRFRAVKPISETALPARRGQGQISAEIIFLEDGFFRVQILENRKIVPQQIDPLKELKQDKINLRNYVNQLPFLDSVRKKIFFTRLFETKYGLFIFYRLNELNVPSNILSIDDLTDKERNYVEGFMLVSRKAVLKPYFEIQKVDPEKAYSRELWDVFNFHERNYILIFHRVYESYEFEIYILKENEIKLIRAFQFGGL
jgi:hypothetical protein